MTTMAAAGEAVGELARETLDERFGRLLKANHAPLTRLTASYAANRSDRDDLLQEIAIALWRALPSFRGECAERTFLFRIAHNRCMTHLSKRRDMVSLDDARIDPRIRRHRRKRSSRRSRNIAGSFRRSAVYPRSTARCSCSLSRRHELRRDRSSGGMRRKQRRRAPESRAAKTENTCRGPVMSTDLELESWAVTVAERTSICG